MAFSNTYIFGFATAVCIFCSLLVSSTAVGLKPIQDLNKERDRKANILNALGLAEEGKKLPGEEIDRLWDERVNIQIIDSDGQTVASDAPKDLNDDGVVDVADVDVARSNAKDGDATPELLAVYRRMDGANVGSTAIPVYGKGLWGPISGFIALDDTLTTISGVTFFAPKETPGLGGEIVEPWFKAQWAGKKVVNDGKFVPVRVAKGEAAVVHPGEVDHWVDGVSGATITCRGVNAMVEDGIDNYDAYLASLR